MKAILVNFLLIVTTLAEAQTTPLKKSQKIPFRNLLKNNGLAIDPNLPNHFESIQPLNKYSNHYFNFTTDLPDNWALERGNALITVIKAVDEETASHVSIGISPLNTSRSHSAYQKDPLKELNRVSKGRYFSMMKKALIENAIPKPYDFKLSSEKVGSINYSRLVYKLTEVTDVGDVEVTTIQFQTELWNTIFTFTYSSPTIFFEENIIMDVLKNTVYFNPNINLSK
jgi:hypothetical protein